MIDGGRGGWFLNHQGRGGSNEQRQLQMQNLMLMEPTQVLIYTPFIFDSIGRYSLHLIVSGWLLAAYVLHMEWLHDPCLRLYRHMYASYQYPYPFAASERSQMEQEFVDHQCMDVRGLGKCNISVIAFCKHSI